MDIALIVGGFALLIAGGEAMIGAAVAIATRLRISPMVIGVTLVGFGTSTPELLTSVQAALAGSPGIAVGNVVGSNVANILLILGLTALIAPFAIVPAAFRRDGAMVAVATLVTSAIILSGSVGRGAGGALAAGLLAYLLYVLFDERRGRSAAGEVYRAEADFAPTPDMRPVRAGLVFAVGLVAMLFGARWLVAGATGLAAALGVPDAVIGVTIVAIGTSLPELVAAVLAARRGESDVALGNVLGSNVFNLLGILGITAIVAPLAVPETILRIDLWAMLAATLALFAAVMSGWRVSRGEGAALLVCYAVYLAVVGLLATG